MKWTNLLSALGAVLVSAVSLAAQAQPGTIAALEYQTPKNGMTKQYEDGRKQKAEWHKQQKDPQPLYVFETISGDNAGTYIVGRLGQHWADFDKPAIPDAVDMEEYNKLIGAYVEKLVPRYWEFMPKVSNLTGPAGPTKFTEVVTFRVHSGREEDFRSAVTRFYDAVQKTKWAVSFGWYALASGGRGGTFVLILPHANWADFEDNPNVKPYREMLKEGLGQAEADSVIKRFDESIDWTYSEIVQFRPDLSYIPAK
jgi:hypothetical protein